VTPDYRQLKYICSTRPLTFMLDQYTDITVEPRHLPHPLDSPLGLKERTEDTGNTNDGNSERVIVVIVNGPE